MRTALLLLAALPLAAPASAQDGAIAAPKAAFASYDPALSARDAVLANWDLAAAGIRAGEVVGGRVVDAADRGVPFERLARQGEAAQSTMIQRWNAAQWVYAGAPGLSRLEADAMRAVAAAVAEPCPEGPCEAEAEALRAAFARTTAQLTVAAADARDAVEQRRTSDDSALMAEQLTLVADYLGGGAWSEDLALAEFGLEGEEVAARIVGAMAIWRNVEPYVGLTDPEVDAAINVAAEQVLRTLRLEMRPDAPLAAQEAELATLRARTETLAAEFRRAADLFGAG